MADSKNRKTLSNHKKSNKILPPLLFPPSTKKEEAWMTQLKKQKKIRKIGPRLYTSFTSAKTPSLVKSQWATIVTRLFPNAVLSHRSALEYKPGENNLIVLTSTTNRKVEYPGLTLHFVRGPAPLDDDTEFLGFRASSLARAILENLSSHKTSSWRSLPAEELEQRLEEILRIKGERELQKLRDRAREIAQKFKWTNEFKKMDGLIGALLGSRPTKKLSTHSARARAQGRPFDTERLERLDNLFAELRSTPRVELKDAFFAKDHFTNKAFFEAYFSNYIEGTTFDIEEAEEIIFEKVIPSNRPKDAHDILGTYNLVANPNEINKTPRTIDELLMLLRDRHRVLMAERIESSPGEFKKIPNRAGDTHFVTPNEVEGTLEKGFERYLSLDPGMARAIFMMFLITEVHPFIDGNGRIARIMMNAELYSQGLSTIIIPTVYRDDYLLNLRALSRRDRPKGLIKTIELAHQFSHMEFSPYGKILNCLEKHNWFRESSEAKIILPKKL